MIADAGHSEVFVAVVRQAPEVAEEIGRVTDGEQSGQEEHGGQNVATGPAGSVDHLLSLGMTKEKCWTVSQSLC